MNDIPVTPEEDEAFHELGGGGSAHPVVGTDSGGVGGELRCDRDRVLEEHPPAADEDGGAVRAEEIARVGAEVDAHLLYARWDEVRIKRFRAWYARTTERRDVEALRDYHVEVFTELIERGIITVNLDPALKEIST